MLKPITASSVEDYSLHNPSKETGHLSRLSRAADMNVEISVFFWREPEMIQVPELLFVRLRLRNLGQIFESSLAIA